MKRWLIRRNKNQQCISLHTYGTPVKPADFRAYGPWPETTAHTRRLCKRKTKRWAARWKGNNFTSEEIKTFLRSEAK